ncbi:MAG: HD domain-containing protein [Planctomycetaceae bacterium]|nr:HD domain-containing protein [Planctomycetaceae bacterium]
MTVESTLEQSRRLLVIDDNREIHDDFRKIFIRAARPGALSEAKQAFFGEPADTFSGLHYEIDDAYQGQEGLDLVVHAIEQQRSYDMAFVDMRMPPGWNGLETVERLWRVDPALHVVICTAYSDHSWRDILARLGRNDRWLVLKKPFDTIEVEQLAAALTEKSRLLRERERYTHQLEEQVWKQTSDIRLAHEETIHRLVAASMYRDKETGEHIRRVGLLSAVLAEAAGWNKADVERIRLAAPMHDVGKIGIPDAILLKPSGLSAEERAVMETHTVIGERLLSGSTSPMLQMAREIALSHHERWDGDGYPMRLFQREIPESARIVAIVDVFDALTHDRVYRVAHTTRAATKSLRAGTGTHFDPDLMDVFLLTLPEIESVLRKHPDSPAVTLPDVAAGLECVAEQAVC